MTNKRIYENLHVLIVNTAELTLASLKQLRAICEGNSIPYDIRDIAEMPTKQEFVAEGFTHIISETVNFDLYVFCQETLVPVTTAQYLLDTAAKNKGLPTRPYSPDPRHVLKDVHLCVGSLPVSDREAIYGGVRALGGSYSDTLSAFVTHVISSDPDEDCVIAAQSVRGFDIKAVLPLWIDHCLKLRKKLDEKPYILGGMPEEEQVKIIDDLDVIEKDLESIEAQDKFLGSKTFYLGQDLELTERAYDLISSLIENSGGIVKDAMQDASFYVGQYRDGEEYITASRSKMYVGNLNWIYWMVEHQKWITPYKKLLHHPYVRGGLPEMREFTIGSTNYTGDARFYIRKLVEALGAEFTTNLKQSNSHLVSSSPKGKKYDAALKWNLKIVNHLWLEECYSNWRLQPYNHPRYAATLSEKIKLEEIVGETSLDIEVLKKFYEEGYTENVTHIVEDSEDDGDVIQHVERHKPAVVVELEEDDDVKNPSTATSEVSQRTTETTATTAEADKEITPEPETDNKENEEPQPSPAKPSITSQTPLKPTTKNIATPATKTPAEKVLAVEQPTRHSSGRKAKDKAAQKLHEDMEQLNYFQKQQKSRTHQAPLLPEEIEEKKRKREEEALLKEANKSMSVEPEETPKSKKKEETPKSKKAKKEASVPLVPYTIVAVSSGCTLEFSKSDTQILSNLGITIVKELKDGVNAIVAPKFMRTEKFLVGLSYGLEYIICPEFLTTVLKQFKSHPGDHDQLPNVDDFSIAKVDPSSVKSLTSLPLNTLLKKAKQRVDDNKRLFQGLSFNITPKIPGGAGIATKILKAHGCKDVRVMKTIKEMKTLKTLKSGKDGDYILISTENGFIDRFKELLSENKASGKVVEWEWVVASIFHMGIDEKNVAFSV